MSFINEKGEVEKVLKTKTNQGCKMNNQTLAKTARELLKNGKGILAIDESPKSLEKKFNKYNIENDESNRQKYRECLITAPDLKNTISGVILQEETFFQKRQSDGKLFTEILDESGILPGIKLDLGLEKINYDEIKLTKFDESGNAIKHNYNEPEQYETISKGIDSLDSRLAEGKFKSARFAKWRCLFPIGKSTPTYKSIHANCQVLAKYAEVCQRYEIVPIVEPEVFFEGSFSIEQHKEVFQYILKTLCEKLQEEKVFMEGVLFKTGFVASGKDSNDNLDSKQVAKHTIEAFHSSLDKSVPGVVFLSGGHTYQNSIDFLREVCSSEKNLSLTFSYGRALTDDAMAEWSKSVDVAKTQQVLIEKCKEVADASLQ